MLERLAVRLDDPKFPVRVDVVELEKEPGIVALNEGWAVAETVLAPMAVAVRPALELTDPAV